MAKKNIALLQTLKREQMFAKNMVPYVLDCMCIAIKESTGCSNEDIECIIAKFQDVVTNYGTFDEVHKIVMDDIGLDLEQYVDKAGRSK